MAADGDSRARAGRFRPFRIIYKVNYPMDVPTLLIIVTIATAQGSDGSQEAQLYETIKDAQAQNMSYFSRGVLEIQTSYECKESDGKTHRGSILAEVTWDDKYVLCSYIAEDADDYFKLPGLNGRITRRNSKPLIAFTSPDKVFFFQSDSKDLFIFKNNQTTQKSLRALDLDPRRNWTRYYAGSGRGWRPWAEMIGPNPSFAANVVSLSLRSLSDSSYEQVRIFKGGKRQEMVMSLDHGGNVLETRFFDAGSRLLAKHTYNWEPVASASRIRAYLLRSYTISEVKDQTTSTLQYQVLRHSVGPRSSPALSVSRFLASLPAGYTVTDYVASQGGGRDKDAKITEEALDRNSETIRSRGFLTRGNR